MRNPIIVLSILLSAFLLVSCAAGSVEASRSETKPPAATVDAHSTPQSSLSPVATQTKAQAPSHQAEEAVTPSPSIITSTPTVAVSETPTATTLPKEHYIRYVYGHKQYFPLGCEASVAVDWAAYYGVEINEFEFQHSLPLSDNPDFGFVGNVEDPWGQVPPYSYGVHAGPIAALLRTYGLNAVGLKGYTIEELKQQIAEDNPVIAWVIGNVVGGVPYEYTDLEGNKTIVAAYEHVIIVIGYNEEMIRYNNNGKIYEIPVEIFENSWSILGNMVVTMGD